MDFTQDGGKPARNMVGIGVVVLLHVILVYALVTGLARKVVDVIQQPVETKIIEEIKPPPPPPPPDKPVPPPPKSVAPPPPFVPPPEVKVTPPPTDNVIAAVTNVKPPSNDLPTSVAQP
ncbi:MAG TPA: energy transducer TonB, partial [Herbaspirillum sp.]|nr:energy transducer TonB [Herbaspirillum sp.]